MGVRAEMVGGFIYQKSVCMDHLLIFGEDELLSLPNITIMCWEFQNFYQIVNRKTSAAPFSNQTVSVGINHTLLGTAPFIVCAYLHSAYSQAAYIHLTPFRVLTHI